MDTLSENFEKFCSSGSDTQIEIASYPGHPAMLKMESVLVLLIFFTQKKGWLPQSCGKVLKIYALHKHLYMIHDAFKVYIIIIPCFI